MKVAVLTCVPSVVRVTAWVIVCLPLVSVVEAYGNAPRAAHR